MPWKESSVMDERMRFGTGSRTARRWLRYARSSASLAQDGHNIFEGYEQCGLEGLSDRIRRPIHYANQLPKQVEAAIVSSDMANNLWAMQRVFSDQKRGA